MSGHIEVGPSAGVQKFRGDLKAFTGFIPLFAMWVCTDVPLISEHLKHGSAFEKGAIITLAIVSSYFGALVDARVSTRESDSGKDLVEIKSQTTWNLVLSAVMFGLFKHNEIVQILHQLANK